MSFHTMLVSLLVMAPLVFGGRPVQAQTETSTVPPLFPEEGGVLPRAPMPEVDPEPVLPPEPPPPPPPAKNPPLPAKIPPRSARSLEQSEELAREAISEDGEKQHLELDWGGYLRVIAQVIENDPESAFIGRNDGFRVGNARLGIKAKYGPSLRAYVSFEASAGRTEELNEANAELSLSPRDLYFTYLFSEQAAIRLGRFKAPYDLGELESTSKRVFIDEPLESRGVVATEGFETDGLSQDRQIGVMLFRDRVGFSKDGFDIGYALALTNGRTKSLVLNDNDRPAGFVRVSILYGDMLDVNLGGFADTRTVGALPNLFDEDVKGMEGSVVLRLLDLRLEAQVLLQRTNYPTTRADSTSAVGAHAQFSYRWSGLEFAYRFAYLDPNDLFEIDAVTEHTFGISYYTSDLPLRFSLNGTLAVEQHQRELENNRLALLSEYVF